jgi:hypothetical protein
MLSPGARSGKRKHGYRRRGCRADSGVGGPGRDRGVDVASHPMMVVSGLGGSSELGAGRLLERGTELGRLEQLAQRARTGTGALAVIAGPAGIGKTRLLEHACAAVGADAQLLRARGGELERTFPYGVVRQLFEPALRRFTPVERRVALGDTPALAAALGRLDDEGPEQETPGEDRFAILHGAKIMTVFTTLPVTGAPTFASAPAGRRPFRRWRWALPGRSSAAAADGRAPAPRQ